MPVTTPTAAPWMASSSFTGTASQLQIKGTHPEIQVKYGTSHGILEWFINRIFMEYSWDTSMKKHGLQITRFVSSRIFAYSRNLHWNGFPSLPCLMKPEGNPLKIRCPKIQRFRIWCSSENLQFWGIRVSPFSESDPKKCSVIVDSPAPVSLSLPQYPSTDEIRMETLTVSAVGRSKISHEKHELQCSRKKIDKKYIYKH